MIPSMLYFLLKDESYKEIIQMMLITIVFTVLFFRLQLFFIPLYCFMTLMNIYYKRQQIHVYFSLVVMTLIFTFGFWVGIKLTDFIFLTQIMSITQRMMGNNQLYYWIFLISQGFIIALSQIIITRKIESRVEKVLN